MAAFYMRPRWRLYDEYDGCCGEGEKIKFDNRWEADVAVWMYEQIYLERMRSYYCVFCEHWHIGHDRPSPEYIVQRAAERVAQNSTSNGGHPNGSSAVFSFLRVLY